MKKALAYLSQASDDDFKKFAADLDDPESLELSLARYCGDDVFNDDESNEEDECTDAADEESASNQDTDSVLSNEGAEIYSVVINGQDQSPHGSVDVTHSSPLITTELEVNNGEEVGHYDDQDYDESGADSVAEDRDHLGTSGTASVLFPSRTVRFADEITDASGATTQIITAYSSNGDGAHEGRSAHSGRGGGGSRPRSGGAQSGSAHLGSDGGGSSAHLGSALSGSDGSGGNTSSGSYGGGSNTHSSRDVGSSAHSGRNDASGSRAQSQSARSGGGGSSTRSGNEGGGSIRSGSDAGSSAHSSALTGSDGSGGITRSGSYGGRSNTHSSNDVGSSAHSGRNDASGSRAQSARSGGGGSSTRSRNEGGGSTRSGSDAGSSAHSSALSGSDGSGGNTRSGSYGGGSNTRSSSDVGSSTHSGSAQSGNHGGESNTQSARSGGGGSSAPSRSEGGCSSAQPGSNGGGSSTNSGVAQSGRVGGGISTNVGSAQSGSDGSGSSTLSHRGVGSKSTHSSRSRGRSGAQSDSRDGSGLRSKRRATQVMELGPPKVSRILLRHIIARDDEEAKKRLLEANDSSSSSTTGVKRLRLAARPTSLIPIPVADISPWREIPMTSFDETVELRMEYSPIELPEGCIPGVKVAFRNRMAEIRNWYFKLENEPSANAYVHSGALPNSFKISQISAPSTELFVYLLRVIIFYAHTETCYLQNGREITNIYCEPTKDRTDQILEKYCKFLLKEKLFRKVGDMYTYSMYNN